MNRLPCLSILLLLAATGVDARISAQSETPVETVAERADAQAAEITDADAFIDEIDTAIGLARSGEYGQLGRSQLSRLDRARNQIAKLLDGHASALELRPDDRIALYNAQEYITSTLRNDDKDRMICKREVRTGTRVPKTECLTVAEREARAETARDNTDKHQRDVCYPGVGNPCKK
jgi:hypothetical protein